MSKQSTLVDVSIRTDSPLDKLMDELLVEAKEARAYALRRAYELWTQADLRADDVGKGLRPGAKGHGRKLAEIEDRAQFPSANHKLTGRIRVSRVEARYLLKTILEKWQRNVIGEFLPIDENPERRTRRIEELLDEVFKHNDALYVPLKKSLESPFEDWCKDALPNAKAAVLASRRATIVAKEPEIAIKEFATDSLNTALKYLSDPSSFWIWLLDYGLANNPQDTDWHAFLNYARLQSALYAYIHTNHMNPTKMSDLFSRAFVVVSHSPTLVQQRYEIARLLRPETFNGKCKKLLQQYVSLNNSSIFPDPSYMYRALNNSRPGNPEPNLLIAVCPTDAGSSPSVHFLDISVDDTADNKNPNVPGETIIRATVKNREFPSNDVIFNEALELLYLAVKNRAEGKGLPTSPEYLDENVNVEEYVLLEKEFVILNVRDFLMPKLVMDSFSHFSEPSST